MRRWLPAAVAAVVMLISGLVHGLQTDRWRWSTPQQVSNAAARLQQVPATMGDWDSQELEMSTRQLERAEAIGHLSRLYTNRADGTQVSVLIVCGRPGPIATHPPTVCFQGTGLSLSAPETHFVVRESNDDKAPLLGEFWLADFHKTVEGLPLWKRTFWAWQATDSWHAPVNPRFAFARNPYLYKLYITRSMTDNRTRPENDPGVQFMREFIPVLNRTLAGN
jgi:hypothetical protein